MPIWREAVELRSGLADLRGQILVVIDQPVGAERPAGRRARDAQGEGALAELGHRRLVDAADAVDLAVLDPLHGVEDLGRRHPVGGAGLVVLAPFGMRPPRLFDSAGACATCCACATPATSVPAATAPPTRPAVRNARRSLVDLLLRPLELFLVLKISRSPWTPSFYLLMYEASYPPVASSSRSDIGYLVTYAFDRTATR